MDVGADDVMRAVAEMPKVAGPAESEYYDMGVSGVAHLRVVDGAYTPDPDRIGPPVIHAWMQWARRRPGAAHAPGSPHPGHDALDHRRRDAAPPRYRGVPGPTSASLSTGPVAMSIAFHDDAPVDEWLLYSNPAIWSGRGLVEGEGRIWTASGSTHRVLFTAGHGAGHAVYCRWNGLIQSDVIRPSR